ncbi:ADP-dependent NAD(P)H-hydrate dehydratase [Leucobacter sp.]
MIERWTREHAAAWLRRPSTADDKYRRGVLGMRTGTLRYPGAAVLGVSAAWRTGAGLLRYVPPLEHGPAPLGLPHPAAAVLAARPETVFGEAAGRPCDAWVIGSGTDPDVRSAEEREALLELLGGPAPAVIDAGALGLAGEANRAGSRRAPAILTPHAGEFERLWEDAFREPLPTGWTARPPAAHGAPAAGAPDEAEAVDGSRATALRCGAALRLAERLGAVLLLKGSVTILASPAGRSLSCGPATPWLATAGTGDVLAGILGALVAARAEEVRADPELLIPIGATAALLHDGAARTASGDTDASGAGGPVAALDIAEAIPAAWAELARE